MAAFLIVSPNPVLDTLYWNRSGQVGERARFSSALTMSGGFGPNVARALESQESTHASVVVLGGRTGGLLGDHLEAESIPFHSVGIPGETRITATIVEGSETRMYVPPSPALPKSALDEMLAIVLDRSCEAVIVGGSVEESELGSYTDFVRSLCQARRVYADIRSDWRDLAAAGPRVLRLPEFGETETPSRVREAVALGASTAMAASPESLVVGDRRELLRVHHPRLEPVNPIGAGDCLLASLANELERGVALREATVTAVCRAGASALHRVPGRFEQAEATRLRSLVVAEPITPEAAA